MLKQYAVEVREVTRSSPLLRPHLPAPFCSCSCGHFASEPSAAPCSAPFPDGLVPSSVFPVVSPLLFDGEHFASEPSAPALLAPSVGERLLFACAVAERDPAALEPAAIWMPLAD
jgi:hypothetical protein